MTLEVGFEFQNRVKVSETDEALWPKNPEAAKESFDFAESFRGEEKKFGINLYEDGADFAVHAGADVDFVDLCIQDLGEPSETLKRWRLSGRDDPELGGKVFDGFVPGLKPGDIYGLRASGDDNHPWSHADYKNMLFDPYAKDLIDHARPSDSYEPFPSVTYGRVVDGSFDWRGDKKPEVDNRVIYEAHVKGLTKLHPGIAEELRGTYAGAAHPEVVAHLKNLGVTTVEFMPVFAFDRSHHSDKNLSNYWGYSPKSFFAPHPDYAATADPVSEFKDMVRTYHEAGIEVVLDVVYNHTSEGGAGGPSESFRGLDNSSYYHIDRYGNYRDKTGCGNMFDASKPAGLEVIKDSMRYWVEEMHVDGFRFDLALSLTRDSSEQGAPSHSSGFMKLVKEDPVLKDTLMIAEPWDWEAYMPGHFGNHPNWTEWNGAFRDVVRDFGRGQGSIRALAHVLAGGSVSGCDLRSGSGSVNFVTAHDGFTLADLVSYSTKHNLNNGENNSDGSNDNHSYNHGVEGETDNPHILALREKAKRNMMAFLLFARGTPMIVAGDELGRTQGGNNNAYCQDSDISWVNWEQTSVDEGSVFDFIKKGIQIRNNGDLGQFDIPEWLNVWGDRMSSSEWNNNPVAAGMRRGDHIMFINQGHEPANFTLPNTENYDYQVVLDSGGPEDDRSGGNLMTLQGLSVAIVRRLQRSFGFNSSGHQFA